MRYLNQDQVAEAIRKAAEKKDKYYLLISTLVKTGLRVSELIVLTPQNVNFQEFCFHIRGKGNKIRTIDIPADLAMQLQIYVKEKKIGKKQPIFKLSRQRVNRITNELAGINAHGLRHSYAIALLRATKNIRYVQRQLGHTSLTTTQIYLQFVEYDEEKKKLASLY